MDVQVKYSKLLKVLSCITLLMAVVGIGLNNRNMAWIGVITLNITPIAGIVYLTLSLVKTDRKTFYLALAILLLLVANILVNVLFSKI